jgi:hypothetical protein
MSDASVQDEDSFAFRSNSEPKWTQLLEFTFVALDITW